MLDLVCKELTLKILKKLISKLKEHDYTQTEICEMLDEADKYGYSLVHYFSGINYFEAIKVIAQYGANVNVRSSNSRSEYPLLIAAAKDYESTVQTLIQCGASLCQNNKRPNVRSFSAFSSINDEDEDNDKISFSLEIEVLPIV